MYDKEKHNGLEIVELEKNILKNKEPDGNGYSNKAFKVANTIKNNCWQKYPESISKDEFEIEYLLAQLYVNLWCLTFKHQFDISLDKRYNIFMKYCENLEKKLTGDKNEQRG